MDHHDITEETVYCIFNDLMEAIDFLSSKQIVHGAILPENIILVESPEVRKKVSFMIQHRHHTSH